jgi:hypothetical protein
MKTLITSLVISVPLFLPVSGFAESSSALHQPEQRSPTLYSSKERPSHVGIQYAWHEGRRHYRHHRHHRPHHRHWYHDHGHHWNHRPHHYWYHW